MLINNYTRILYGILAATAIASCSLSTNLDGEIERDVKSATKFKEESKVPTETEALDLVRVKNDIWLGDKSQIEYEGDPIPQYLETTDGVTLVSNRPITLFELGDMISKITSVGVRYAAHLEEDIRDAAKENTPNTETINADWAEPDKMLVSYKGPLSGLLDEISTRFGIWWKFEKNEIYFYKFESRTFVLYSLPTKPSLTVSMGGSSSGESGNASTSLSSNIDIELWANIEKAIQSMLGTDSKLTMDPANGTISVEATPLEMKKVSKFINEQNARLSRQVSISVKIYQVTLSSEDKYGLDFAGLYSGKDSSFELKGISGGAGFENSNNFKLNILPGKWDIKSFVQALSTKNDTSLVTSGTVTTLNNKPAPIQVTKKQNYISEITKTNSGSGDDGSDYDISTTTEEIETGFTLDVLPRILEHGRLLVMFNLTLSDLIALEKVYLNTTEGKENSGQYIQNPIIETRGFTQEVALKSGETLILSGYERVESKASKSGIGSAEKSLLGGTTASDKDRSVLVIMLTPVVLESPLTSESRMN